MSTRHNYTANGPIGYTFSQKWGDDPFTALGHTQVPDALIGYAARLGLVPEECWLIVCILKFKHTPHNPYPSQEKLAGILGQSEDTVRRLLKRISRRGLVSVERVRGDLGHYTHSVYDFTPLRAALNEAFYQDHPEERPKEERPKTAPPGATVQKCTVGATTPQNVPQPPRKIARHYPAKCADTTPQNCGPKKSRDQSQEKEHKEQPKKTLNVSPESDAVAAEAELTGRAPSEAALTARATGLLSETRDGRADAVAAELRDWGSEARHRQLLAICDRHGLTDLPQQALCATRERLAVEGRRGPVRNAGAYYQTILIALLQDRRVFVPTAAEAGEMRAELGLPRSATRAQVHAALKATLPPPPGATPQTA